MHLKTIHEFSICRQEARKVEWHFTKTDPSEALARLSFFSMTKREPQGNVDFHITVREYAVPPAGQRLRFFAEANKEVNQKSAPILPSGWGDSVQEALEGCLRLIRQFPYEGEEQSSKRS
jgi:hypothetical protein